VGSVVQATINAVLSIPIRDLTFMIIRLKC